MRRSEPESSSLDLLLDTITNTFGGILFVTILVVLLLRFSGGAALRDSTNVTSASQMREQESELLKRVDEIASLKQVAASQQRSLEHLSQGNARELYSRLLELRKQMGSLAIQKAGLESQVARLTTKGTEAQSKARSLSTQVEREKDIQKQLEEAFENETRKRTRTAALPTLRSTAKREYPLILRYGRLYAPYFIDEVSGERVRKLDDFSVIGEEAGAIRVSPKPYRGMPLSESREGGESLNELLSSFDKELFYVGVAVWDDSFPEFALLKSALVSLDIEYRLLPTKSGDAIQEGANTGAYVQ